MVDVLHFAPFDAGRYPPLLNTLAICREAGLTSFVLSSVPIPQPELFPGVGLEHPAFPSGGVAQLRELVVRGRALLDRLSPRLVIGHNVQGLVAAWLAGAARRGSAVVYHCHDFWDVTGARGRAFAIAERIAAGKASEIWVPARERVETASRRGLRRPIRIVQNCPLRVPDLPPRGALRAWLAEQGVAEAKSVPLILRHGRIGPAHYLVETVRVLPELPGVHFVVIGDGGGNHAADCRELAARLAVADRLHFHDFVPHDRLAELLVDGNVGMSVYSPISINEAAPAPNKVFENMALGVPVVVGAGNSIADDVLSSGAGRAVEIGSTERLRQAFAELLSDEGRTASKAAREAHLSRYNYEFQLRETILSRVFPSVARVLGA